MRYGEALGPEGSCRSSGPPPFGAACERWSTMTYYRLSVVQHPHGLPPRAASDPHDYLANRRVRNDRPGIGASGASRRESQRSRRDAVRVRPRWRCVGDAVPRVSWPWRGRLLLRRSLRARTATTTIGCACITPRMAARAATGDAECSGSRTASSPIGRISSSYRFLRFSRSTLHIALVHLTKPQQFPSWPRIGNLPSVGNR